MICEAIKKYEEIDEILMEITGFNSIRILEEDEEYTDEEIKILENYFEQSRMRLDKAKEEAYHEVWDMFREKYHIKSNQIPQEVDWEFIKTMIDECMGYDDCIEDYFCAPMVFERMYDTVGCWVVD